MELETPLLLVHLDAYNLGDPLFLTTFARDLKARRGPVILFHGSGDSAARMLEARGLLGKEDKLAPVAQQLVDRAIRELNRRVVHTLNDAGIAAVGILGVDRSLLGRFEDGELRVGSTRWLVDLALQGGVPVVGSLARTSETGVLEVDSADALAGIAISLRADGVGDLQAVAFTSDRRGGLFENGTLLARVSPARLDDFDSLPRTDELRRMALAVRTRVTSPRSLRGDGRPIGTDIGEVAR